MKGFINGQRVATSRRNELASLVEQFLDSNEEYISPQLFEWLDDLAAEIDGIEDVKEKELSDLQEQVEQLENQLEELNNDN